MLKQFTKYVGCGNDFILFDDRGKWFPFHNKSLIKRLCHRQYGIGADGILLVQPSSQADFRMRILNPDASEAEMCGNGIRCFAKFLLTLGFEKNPYLIETMERLLKIDYVDEDVSVEMGNPTDIRRNISLEYKGKKYLVHAINTGVPHSVIFDQDIENFSLHSIGPYFRNHPFFQPRGTNVNVAQRLNDNFFKMRTYERGVEAETLACGTGATAVALLAACEFQLASPIVLQTASNENLTIEFTKVGNEFTRVRMTGPAFSTYKGEVLFD